MSKTNKPKTPKTKNILTAFKEGNHSVVKIIVEKFKKDVKSTESSKIYGWDQQLGLWKHLSFTKYTQKIFYYLGDLLDVAVKRCEEKYDADDDRLKAVIKLRKSSLQTSNIKQIAEMSLPDLEDQSFIDKIDRRTDVINFKNGIYEFKTKIFRRRAFDDLFSKCLDYNFGDADPKYTKIVKTLISRIANDKKEDYDAMLSWFGFCLTGECNKSFLLLQGHTSNNGKSSICKFFISSFPIYGKKIDREFLFLASRSTRHKTVAELELFRMILIEELDRTKCDTLLLKEWCDGGFYPYKVMYGTEDKIFIQSKLNITTNKDPVFPSDNGIINRGNSAEFVNVFVNKSEYDEANGAPGIYLKDEDLENKFRENDKYKLAFLHLLLPYACKYYTDRLVLPKSYKDNFTKLCGMNDPTMDFINDHFKITKDANDRIYKDDLLNMYKAYSGLNRCTVNYLSSEIKKYGITYEKAFQINNKRGCFIGIKKIKDIEKGDGNNDDIDVIDI
jgi:phage/plasmid-associated DNA primase